MALIPKENLVKASNLVFVSVGIIAARFIIYLFHVTYFISISSFIISIVLYSILAFFIRGGFNWARYTYLFLLSIMTILAPFAAYQLAPNALMVMIFTIQFVVQIYAGILMFRKRESGYNS
jgi:hypothetical protein